MFVYPYPFFFFLKIYFLICWLWWVFVAVWGLPLVVASRGYSSLRCVGFSLQWLLLLWNASSRHLGFSSCSCTSLALETGSWWWHTGLVGLWHVGSSRPRDQTSVPFIVRQILNYWTTREVPVHILCFFSSNYTFWVFSPLVNLISLQKNFVSSQ